MPQVSGRFGPYPVTVVLDGSGNGQVEFQAVGANVRITNGYASVSTQVLQASATAYKQLVGPGYAVSSTESGSTGAPFKGPFDLLDGERLIVRWTGGDPGAVATATFTGLQIPFNEISGSVIEWENPFAANDGTIVFPALQSPNYVPSTTGWRLDRNGNVDFAAGSFRGEVFILGSNGSYIRVYANGSEAEIDIQPPMSGTATFTPGSIKATSAGDVPLVEFVGAAPLTPVAGGAGQLNLGADPVLNQTAALLLAEQINIGDAASGSTIDMLSQAVRVQGNDIGRGLWSYAGDTADSATSAVEFVILTIPSKTYKAGRLYRIDVTGRTAPSAASAPLYQVRKTNLAGAVVYVLGRVDCSAAQEFVPPPSGYFLVGAADVTTALALTLNGGGTNVRQESSSSGRTFTTWDVGIAATMPDVAELT